jgi:hypothetical protein
MNPDIAAYIAIASGLFALIGSLGSQLINSFANLKSKKFELIYLRKIDAYKELTKKAIMFRYNPTSEKIYYEFQEVFIETIPFASDEVYLMLAQTEDGIIHIGKKVFQSEDDEERKANVKLFARKIDNLVILMRKDLNKLR